MFAFVARDELWTLGVASRVRERRLTHGQATLAGPEIVADDAADESLLAICDREMEAALATLPHPRHAAVAARVVVTARRAAGNLAVEATIALTAGWLSLVTTPDAVAEDCARLLEISAVPPEIEVDYRGLPLLWQNGSASVLLHEAAGHPAEHRRPAIAWPDWLSVCDEPRFDVDDTGRRVTVVDLLQAGQPSAMRRASFRDIPLPRLSNVVARQREAPYQVPERRIEVLLVSGGRYDPLTDDVTLFISASDLVDSGVSQRLHPFVMRESRESVSRAIRGAHGDPIRYPGVICSSEGQEIVVGSCAPRLITVF